MTNNPTEKALLARGVDSELAASIRNQGYTLDSLKLADDRSLSALGLSQAQIDLLRRESRPPIQMEDLTRVLFDNRWVCCICRDASRPIIVHHIREWSESRDHTPANLALLCSLHHSEAHTQRQLEQNLTGPRIARSKAMWEAQVRRDDAAAIQEGTVLQAETWFYFNHLRLYELAIELGVDVAAEPNLAAAVAAGVCRPDGTVSKAAAAGSFMYADSDRGPLFRFMLGLLRAVLADAPLRNISDYLDRGVLGCLVTGDVIFVQGLHTFTPQSPAPVGSQLSRAKRSANRVVVSFVYDLREATSSSAWSTWLRGTGNVGCLLRVQRLSRLGPKLHVECTVLAIRSAYRELKQRTYELRLLESGLPERNEEGSEDELAELDKGAQRAEQ
jgi:hypothetical protein